MTQQPYQQQTSQRPGQMTAMMRAVMPSGPKVLRIGLVQGGRVIEERIIKQRTHVSVGPSEKAMFVVTSGNLPPTFRLFELVGNEYCLNFLEGMTGRVALPTGISDLSVLRGQARRTPQGAYQIRLTEDSRGKVVVGDLTFLFQFVAPPPVQPKPQLPVSVTRGASGIDWATTMIAAMSFLLHFMALGAIYSDWLDPIVDDDVAVESLIEDIQSLPVPAIPVEEKEPEEIADTPAEKVAEKPKASSGGSSNKGAGQGAGPMSAAQVAALSSELDQLEMATIGALSSDGPATAGVLGDGYVPTGDLGSAARSGSGVTNFGGLVRGGGGGPGRPGMKGRGLAGIGKKGRSAEAKGSGEAAEVRGPVGNASVGGASVAGGQVSNADRVIAGMRGTFRACYNADLASNPTAKGSIRLTIRVGPGGEVQSVSAAPNGSFGSTVQCVKDRARVGSFEPPADGGSATIAVNLVFMPQ